MSNIKICTRFRPLTKSERIKPGLSPCIQKIDEENFEIKDDENNEIYKFKCDRVYYQESEQADVFEFLALPMLQGAIKGKSGLIIASGQSGGGKTYSIEGRAILRHPEEKGLLTRAVEWLVDSKKSTLGVNAFTIKFSLVENNKDQIKDLFDLSRKDLESDNGCVLDKLTEIILDDPKEDLECIFNAIAERDVKETGVNAASSQADCLYIFTVQQDLSTGERITGKFVLVDFAAEGRVLEESTSVNKSVYSLGKVVDALTCPMREVNDLPNQLTILLKKSLDLPVSIGLLSCCIPANLFASEIKSAVQFAQLLKQQEADESETSGHPPIDIFPLKGIIQGLEEGKRAQMEGLKAIEEAVEAIASGRSTEGNNALKLGMDSIIAGSWAICCARGLE